MPAKQSIHFFSEDIEFKLKNQRSVKKWIIDAVSSENRFLNQLNFIFCSDEYLLGINQRYLNHNTYTDIITFDNSGDTQSLIGDIFISIDRIRENAEKFKVSEVDELHRVMIHGVLHLLGYGDKQKPAKLIMTAKENEYLKKRTFI
jgi:probable rRNA maturation factor